MTSDEKAVIVATRAELDHCRSCNARVFWAIFPSGKLALFNAMPDARGLWTVSGTRTGAYDPVICMIPKRRSPDDPTRYTPHFATCAQAKTWRRK